MSARIASLLALASTACAAGFGASVGVTADTQGHLGVLLKGFSRGGSRGTPTNDTETGYFWLPQLEASVGYDVSHAGLQLGAGIPWLGYVRAPKQEGDVAWGFQVLMPRFAYTWSSNGPNQMSYGVGNAVMVGRALAASTMKGTTLHTVGGWIDLGVAGTGPSSRGGWGDTVGQLFAGPYYEYLSFFDFQKRPYP